MDCRIWSTFVRYLAIHDHNNDSQFRSSLLSCLPRNFSIFSIVQPIFSLFTMLEEVSPFDQAILNPMVPEKSKKPWWSFRKNTDPAEMSPDRTYVAPNFTHEITFANNTHQNQETSLLLSLEEGMIEIEPEQAMLQERHGSIQEINTSMKQIHQIQKGK